MNPTAPLVQPQPFPVTKVFPSLSLSLQILIFFHLFDFFFTYPTITWYSNINDDGLFDLFVDQK